MNIFSSWGQRKNEQQDILLRFMILPFVQITATRVRELTNYRIPPTHTHSHMCTESNRIVLADVYVEGNESDKVGKSTE